MYMYSALRVLRLNAKTTYFLRVELISCLPSACSEQYLHETFK